MLKRKYYFSIMALAIIAVLTAGNFEAYAKDGRGDEGDRRPEKIERKIERETEREYDEDKIPEQDGDYKVRGVKETRVKVFVHGEKPQELAAGSLTCGLADPDAAVPVDSNAWRLPETWTYRLNLASAPASVGAANLPVIAAAGFAAWSEPSGVNFIRGADTTTAKKARDNKNIIAWGTTSRRSSLGVTYIWYTSVSKKILEVDTILNKKKPWGWTPYSAANLCGDPYAYDAQNILTHEIGHWLGMQDEYGSKYKNSTMYGYGGKGEVKKDTLTTGDILGLAAAYAY